MTLNASELLEAALTLPPSVRKNIALRLLESVQDVDDESVEETWTAELTPRTDDASSRLRTSTGEQGPARPTNAEIVARIRRRDRSGAPTSREITSAVQRARH